MQLISCIDLSVCNVMPLPRLSRDQCASCVQPYAEADAKESAKSKADEEAKAATKTNGAGKAADAKADDKAGAKKVRSCIKVSGAPVLEVLKVR